MFSNALNPIVVVTCGKAIPEVHFKLLNALAPITLNELPNTILEMLFKIPLNAFPPISETESGITISCGVVALPITAEANKFAAILVTGKAMCPLPELS